MIIKKVKILKRRKRKNKFLLVSFVNIYLLDTVTGSLKLSHTHKRVKSPVHVVLAENWIVVSLNFRNK